MFTNEEMQLIINDINEGARRDGLVNAAVRLSIVATLQQAAQQQAEAKVTPAEDITETE